MKIRDEECLCCGRIKEDPDNEYCDRCTSQGCNP